MAALSFSQDAATDEKIIERYKLMLVRNPKEGSTFDRLYQFYLDSSGLAAMVSDYEAMSTAKPNDPNLHLILGHIYKRLGRDTKALAAYQRAVTLSQHDYYAHYALGKFYSIGRKHEDAIRELTKALSLSEQAQTVSPEELADIYKTLGHAYFRQDMVDKAIKTWEQIATLDPDDIFARITLADLFREQALYPQAIAQYEAIINLKKADTYRHCMSLREIGKIYEAAGEYPKALKHYDAALDLTTRGNWLRKDLQHRIIAIYSETDATGKDLIAYWTDKLQTHPNDPETLGLLAAAYIENRQLTEGIDTYKQGLTVAPTDVQLRRNLISALRHAEKFEDAAAQYEILLEQHADDIEIYRELGELYLQQKHTEKTKHLYQRLIDRYPKQAHIYMTVAEIYTEHGWLTDAVTVYQKALSLDPDNLDYITAYGEFYYKQGERQKALETWHQMVTDTKGIAENYDRLAQLLETKKFLNEAIDASRKAVELMPDTYRFSEALATRLMHNEQYDAALLAYTEAMLLAPNAFFAEQLDDKRIELYKRQGTLAQKIEDIAINLQKTEMTDDERFAQQQRLAKMYLKFGSTNDALEILLEARKLRPDAIHVNRSIANMYVQQGRHDEAIPIYRHLTTIDSANAREYYTNIAKIYLETMDFAAAKAAAKQVIAQSPRHPEGHRLLAQIHKHSGDIDAAADRFKQAIRLRPEAIDMRRELAQLYRNSGSFHLAIAQYWRCWQLSDAVQDKLSFIQPLAEAYNNLGRQTELAERLKQKAKSRASGIAPVLALAQLYRSEGDLTKARLQLTQALDQQRKNPELLYQLVGISLDLGDIDAALSYQQQLVEADPDPAHQQKLGELLFDVGREQAAVQLWSKMLHQQQRSLDAEIRLARLLIRHGLMAEALQALDTAAEKITGTDAYIGLSRIGTTLVEIGEPEKAIPYFQQLIAMKPTPNTGFATPQKKSAAATSNFLDGPPGININKLHLAKILENRLRPQQSAAQNPWLPTTFEEAQAAALVQLKTILDDLGKLDDMFAQFEEKVTANPKDIQTLERLAQLYILTNNPQKTDEVLDKLIAAAPNNLIYKGIKLRFLVTRTQFNYNDFTAYLEEMTGLPTDAKHWYLIEHAALFVDKTHPENAAKLLDTLEKLHALHLRNSHKLIDLFVQNGRVETAEKMLSELHATHTTQLSQRYTRIYEAITNTAINNGEPDKAIASFWKYIEKTHPKAPHVRSSFVRSSLRTTNYPSTPTRFPSPTVYYNQTRLDFLQKFFTKIWIKEQQALFYNTLEAKYEQATGRDRIYPALAISYCHWWDSKRDKALDMLQNLRTEFPDDLTLTLHTIFAAIHGGKYFVAADVLEECMQSTPKHPHQFFDLTLYIAMSTGDSSPVHALLKNILNAPVNLQALYDFSQKLQTAGFTQHAVAVAQKAMGLASRERDPRFLRKFSSHLNALGRGQDAAQLLQRAVKLENLKSASGQTLLVLNNQIITRAPQKLKTLQNHEARLVRIAEQYPTSFKAQSNLATFYASRHQVQKAMAAYQTALALRPNATALRNQFIDMLRRTGKTKKAIEHYTYILKNNLASSQYNAYHFRQIIETYGRAGEINKLVAIAKDVVANHPSSQRSHEFVHSIAQHFENNNVKPIIEIYEKSLETGTDTYFDDLVSAYIATGNQNKARHRLIHKLKNDPAGDHAYLMLRLSELDEGFNDLKNLVEAYTEKFAIDTDEPTTLYPLALLKIITDDLAGSDLYVQKLLQYKNYTFELLTIAHMYRNKGDLDRQQRVLEALVEFVDLQETEHLAQAYQDLGKRYADKGEKAKAQNAIRKMGKLRLLQHGSTQYHDKETIARTYIKHELYDEAETLLIDIINDPSAYSHAHQLAQTQLATIRLKRGGGTATELKNTMADMNLGLRRTKAQRAKSSGNYYEALRIYEQIVNETPDNLASRAELASLYIRHNEHDKAIAMWETLLKIDPANTKYQDGLVNTYKMANRTNEAIQFAQRYIQENPDIGLYHARLADLYATTGQIDTAIVTYKKALALSTHDAKSHEALAKLYEKKRDYGAAEKAYHNALKFSDPSSRHTQIMQGLMKIYQRQGRLEEILTQAEAQGTLTFYMQRESARLYRNSGDLEKAADAYQKALGMTAGKYARSDIQRHLIDIYSKLGKLEDYLKETEEHGTTSFEMQEELARLYQSQREYDKAADAYRKAMHMATQPHERHTLERHMMQLYRQSGKLEQFLKDMEKDGTLSADMQVELAKYYSARGQSEKAIAAYQKADNMANRDQAGIASLLILEFVKLDKTDKAIEIYENYENGNTTNPQYIRYVGSFGFEIASDKEQVREALIKTFKQNRKLNTLETIYKTKLENKPNDIDMLTVLAEIYRNSNNHEKTAEVYQKLCEIEPANVRNYYYGAAALKRDGQAAQAQTYVEKGARVLREKRDGTDAMLLCTLGSICYQSKMYEPAITLFKEAATANAMTGIANVQWQQERIYEILGKIYMETQQYEEAVEAYQHKLKLATHDYDRDRIEKEIKRAYAAGKLYEKHIPAQLAKVQQHPNNAQARITLAESYVASKRYTEAIAQYEKLCELQPTSPKWHKTIGDLYGKTHRCQLRDFQPFSVAYKLCAFLLYVVPSRCIVNPFLCCSVSSITPL